MKNLHLGALLIAMTVGVLSFSFAIIVRPIAEERAIATIVRSGGQVYYGFQEPKLSVRRRSVPSAHRATRISSFEDLDDKKISLASGVAGIPSTMNGGDIVYPADLNPSSSYGDTNSLDGAEPKGAMERVESYFEVAPLKGYRVHMAARIATDLLRRIECATVSGASLDDDVVSALTDLWRLRQLIVYDLRPEQREPLTRKLPNVEIIWR